MPAAGPAGGAATSGPGSGIGMGIGRHTAILTRAARPAQPTPLAAPCPAVAGVLPVPAVAGSVARSGWRRRSPWVIYGVIYEGRHPKRARTPGEQRRPRSRTLVRPRFASSRSFPIASGCHQPATSASLRRPAPCLVPPNRHPPISSQDFRQALSSQVKGQPRSRGHRVGAAHYSRIRVRSSLPSDPSLQHPGHRFTSGPEPRITIPDPSDRSLRSRSDGTPRCPHSRSRRGMPPRQTVNHQKESDATPSRALGLETIDSVASMTRVRRAGATAYPRRHDVRQIEQDSSIIRVARAGAG